MRATLFGRYSNTTLVKVKSNIASVAEVQSLYSNTTLVKVKYVANEEVPLLAAFKYNTC